MEEFLKQLIGLPNTYIGDAPVGIDDCQWITSTSGSQKMYFGGGDYRYPTFSIYVRRENNKQAHDACEQLFETVHRAEFEGAVCLGTRLPRFVGRDAKGRSVYAFSIGIQIGG